MASPQEVLGIDPDADEAAVETAYRRRVKETHPDQGGSLRAFLRVRMAYEALAAEAEPGAGESERPGETRPRSPGQDTGASPGTGGGSPGSTRDDAPAETARVEYLDYEVLADHGWSLDDEDLFENAAAADLAAGEYGRFLVEDGESLLEAAEGRGFAWPYACRGGACANCAVAVRSGELSIPVNHVLPDEQVDRDVRLSCVGEPATADLQVVFNVKHLPDLDELRLPPHPFEQARRRA